MKNSIENLLYNAFQMFMQNLGSFLPPRIRIREKIPDPDPDPWPENIPDPHGSGSGSETLVKNIYIFFNQIFCGSYRPGVVVTTDKGLW